MFIDKESVLIDGVNMGSYLTQAEFGYNKLWSSDSGRNMAGEQSGTLVGIFPKIVLSFRKLTETELGIIAPILDKATQSTTYYDPCKKSKITMSTYSGDWSVVNKNIGINEPFNVSVISRKRRE